MSVYVNHFTSIKYIFTALEEMIFFSKNIWINHEVLSCKYTKSEASYLYIFCVRTLYQAENGVHISEKAIK